jgi:hypothetical protein
MTRVLDQGFVGGHMINGGPQGPALCRARWVNGKCQHTHNVNVRENPKLYALLNFYIMQFDGSQGFCIGNYCFSLLKP